MKWKIITVTVITAILALILILINKPDRNESKAQPEPAPSKTAVPDEKFDVLRKNVIELLAPDAIPPIDDPIYVSADDVYFLSDTDKVFVLESTEGTYIYPQKIMVWHEVVNELIDDTPVSVTYCPLTGSVIGYSGLTAGDEHNTLGTSGSLVNSNLVLYDRSTNSLIPQILGIGVTSDLENHELETVPIFWADWADALEAYPDAQVLSIKTGFTRDYSRDPYGSYRPDSKGTYYTSGGPMFNVLNEDDSFPSKKVVTGVKYADSTVALDPDAVKEAGTIEFEIGGSKAYAVYDESIKTVRVHLLNPDGSASDEAITYFDVMWFAWYAYYPDTVIINGDNP